MKDVRTELLKDDVIIDALANRIPITEEIIKQTKVYKKAENKREFLNRINPLIEDANKSYTSFLEALKLVASRTPAQSHQSFMPMKIVAFTDTGLNSAYVSRFQLWLQGSDFDIDKVSLLSKEFSNGKYITWSSIQEIALQNPKWFEQVQYIDYPTGEYPEFKSQPNEGMTDTKAFQILTNRHENKALSKAWKTRDPEIIIKEILN